MGLVGSVHRAMRGPARWPHEAARRTGHDHGRSVCEGSACGGSGSLLRSCWAAIAPFVLLAVVVLLVLCSANAEQWLERAGRGISGTCESDHLAAMAGCGDLDEVRKLIAGGVDPGLAGARGITPLMCAAQTPRTDVLEFLLLSGADVNAQDAGGFTALMLAVRAGRPRAVELLLRAGADPDAESIFGRTAMDLALEAEDVQMQRVISDASARRSLR